MAKKLGKHQEADKQATDLCWKVLDPTHFFCFMLTDYLNIAN